jgi:hypothetical protein
MVSEERARIFAANGDTFPAGRVIFVNFDRISIVIDAFIVIIIVFYAKLVFFTVKTVRVDLPVIGAIPVRLLACICSVILLMAAGPLGFFRFIQNQSHWADPFF